MAFHCKDIIKNKLFRTTLNNVANLEDADEKLLEQQNQGPGRLDFYSEGREYESQQCNFRQTVDIGYVLGTCSESLSTQ
jgi:hypothetical protein